MACDGGHTLGIIIGPVLGLVAVESAAPPAVPRFCGDAIIDLSCSRSRAADEGPAVDAAAACDATTRAARRWSSSRRRTVRDGSSRCFG